MITNILSLFYCKYNHCKSPVLLYFLFLSCILALNSRNILIFNSLSNFMCNSYFQTTVNLQYCKSTVLFIKPL